MYHKLRTNAPALTIWARNGLFLEINVPFLELFLEMLEILEISSRRDAPYSRIPGQTIQL